MRAPDGDCSSWRDGWRHHSRFADRRLLHRLRRWNDVHRRLHRQRTPQSLSGLERANLRRHGIRSREENREAWRHHHHPGRRGARMARHSRARGLSQLPAVAGHSHRGLGSPGAQEVMASKNTLTLTSVLAVVAVLFAYTSGTAAQRPAELIIRNGLIVTVVGRTDADLRIRNGVIAEIGRNLTAAAGAQVIDAKGMLVLPGGIDPHVHLTPMRTAATLKGADDYTSASRAALAGGKTTISNFITLAANTDLRPLLAEATDLVQK